MKKITSHHDGHGRMEKLSVLATDEPATAPNSSHHRYSFRHGDDGPEVGYIQFQRGPFDAVGSTPGTLTNAVLAALVDHLQGFQAGPLANRETALAVTKLQEAMFWLRARADDRAAKGVLGTMESGRPLTFYINGEAHVVPRAIALTYSDVVRMSPVIPPPGGAAYTVTYSRAGADGNASGTLLDLPNHAILAVDGTRFDVADTSAA